MLKTLQLDLKSITEYKSCISHHWTLLLNLYKETYFKLDNKHERTIKILLAIQIVYLVILTHVNVLFSRYKEKEDAIITDYPRHYLKSRITVV